MTKKINDSDTNRRKVFTLPDVHHMDMIGYMTDEEISSFVSRLESERNHALNKGYDPTSWEVEIAYFRREQQLRKIRAERHAEYLSVRKHLETDDNEVVNLDATQDEVFVPQNLN
jgi:hypothetical protein